jgi:RsiW-degrading membrane proteinase PrsW (M82 family)
MLAVLPALLVVTTFTWLGRVEPEPWPARVHALLWGAAVAGLFSGLVNTTVALFWGEDVAAVFSAPLVEEVTKGLGVWWVLQHGLLRTPLAGVVYAGFIGAGFALTENQAYFLEAAQSGNLVTEFVSRGLATSFMHPFLTMWTGLAIGWVARHRKGRAVCALVGLLIAVLLHGLWNFTAVDASAGGSGALQVLTPLLFLALFSLTVLVLLMVTVRSHSLYRRALPGTVFLYGLDPLECAMFDSWSSVKRARHRSGSRRREFERLHSAVRRLFEHHHPGRSVDQDLYRELLEARYQYHRPRTVPARPPWPESVLDGTQ